MRTPLVSGTIGAVLLGGAAGLYIYASWPSGIPVLVQQVIGVGADIYASWSSGIPVHGPWILPWLFGIVPAAFIGFVVGYIVGIVVYFLRRPKR